MEKPPLPTALYCRLSREDGDRMESDSIGNQRKLLEAYIENHPELVMAECYADDGYTGTNFQRPAFQRMLRDIENGRIHCVLVKDLSRFGRDYIETGRYLERWLPEHGARFIAVTDNIDSDRGAYDMMMPLKNLFNTQYARDISQRSKAPSTPSSSGASLSEPSPATATVRTRKTITVLLSIRLRRRWCNASSPCLKTEWVRSALPSN